jgi:hypothetical protein
VLAQALLEAHLVTPTQRCHALVLFGAQALQLPGGLFMEETARPADATGQGEPKGMSP